MYNGNYAVKDEQKLVFVFFTYELLLVFMCRIVFWRGEGGQLALAPTKSIDNQSVSYL